MVDICTYQVKDIKEVYILNLGNKCNIGNGKPPLHVYIFASGRTSTVSAECTAK